MLRATVSMFKPISRLLSISPFYLALTRSGFARLRISVSSFHNHRPQLMALRKYSVDVATAEVSIMNSTYHCCKRCARKRQRSRYIPREIVFRFLLHLPAQLLRDVARHVCREWSLIIRSPNFARHHYRNLTGGSGGGVLIQAPVWPRVGFYLEMRRGRLEISKLDCGFEGVVRSSCSGLVVLSNCHEPAFDYITNPLTKQLTALPPFSALYAWHSDCGLAFVEASMVYKVARACRDVLNAPKMQIAVLTVGVDRAWRRIDVRDLVSEEFRRLSASPLVTGVYVHWVNLKVVLTMNLETETVSRFSPPPPTSLCGKFLAMGNSLSFVQISGNFRDVWEMNCATGEWSMLFRFDKEPIFKGMIGNPGLVVECWLVTREVLVYAGQTSGIAFNVKTGEIQRFEWESRVGESFHFEPHVNSLVWWEEE